MAAIPYGLMNGPAAGIVMKEAMRRAMATIRLLQHSFEIHPKASCSGAMDDLFTTADVEAQKVYFRVLRECFPDWPIVAEEGKISVPSGTRTYFNVDPMDGTKAFKRRQTHGVGSMLSLVHDGEVVAAYIGDIHSGIVYGYRPESDKVHRVTALDTAEELRYHTPFVVSESYALLRDPPDRYGADVERFLSQCKSYNIDGGSIGLWMSRLWRREVQAAVLLPSHETPWDGAPVIGISKKLGYEFLRPEAERWVPYDPVVRPEVYYRDHPTLVMHKEDLKNLR